MRLRAFLIAALTLAVVPAAASADYAHVVVPGETLTSVAKTDGLSVAALAAANGISTQAELITGQILEIPPQEGAAASTGQAPATTSTATTSTNTEASSQTGTTAPAGAYAHVVLPGETLTSVAEADGLSIAALAAANGISTQAELIAGQILWIPPRGAFTATPQRTTTTSSSATASTPADDTTQAASSDDEAAEEAAEHETGGTGITQDVSRTESSASGSATSSSTSSSPGGQIQATAGGATPQPTNEQVSGAEIAAVAGEYGVPAAFAEAIAWQESGWSNAVVSGVGAVGVMQIVPGTWDWIDKYLTPTDPLGTASASENIRAGVLLLHQLLQLTGGSESLAAAGYFQGLASVNANGVYPSTQRYVNDVMALTARFGG